MASHLVIQGPRISYFTKFCPPRSSADCVTVNGKQAFDSAANIARTAETFRDLFDTIVVSYWDSDELPNEAELKSLGVVLCRLPAQSVAAYPNYVKQVVGVVEGAKAIGKLDPRDRVVKTRTDLSIDLRAVIEHADRADEQYTAWREAGQEGFIHIANSRGPFFLEDMFVTARGADFMRFWEATLPDRQRFGWGGIHQLLPLEYAWQNRERLGIAAEMFLDFYRWAAPWYNSSRRLLRENRLWQYLMTHCFCLMPEIDASSFLWRGNPNNHQTNRHRLKRYQFFEQWELLQTNGAALEPLTDLLYFESRKARGLRDYLSATRRAIQARTILRSGR